MSRHDPGLFSHQIEVEKQILDKIIFVQKSVILEAYNLTLSTKNLQLVLPYFCVKSHSIKSRYDPHLFSHQIELEKQILDKIIFGQKSVILASL